MNAYLLGLVTIPAVVLGGYLGAFLVAKGIALTGLLALGTCHRIRPDGGRMVAERRAAVMFGLRRGVVFSRGEFVLILGVDLDKEARDWAHSQLRPKYDLSDDFKRRTTREESEQ